MGSARTRQLCSQCGRLALAQARVDDQVICGSCDKRWQNSKARCSACGLTRRPARGQANAGFCEPCAGITNSQVCARCGAEAKLYATARCTDCYLHDEIGRMRASGEPTAVRQLDAYLQALGQARPANSVLHWLRISRTSAAPVLRELVMGARPLTHEALDELSDSHAIAFLRAALVQHGALPERDELVHRFELWTEQVTNVVPDHPDRTALRRWATWVVLHDLRARRRSCTEPVSDKHARTLVRVTAHFLAWLDQQELTLATTHQEHVDQWLAQGNTTSRQIRPFLSWTSKAHLTVPLSADHLPERRLGEELEDIQRLQLIARLIADEDLELRTRAAGLLIWLYGQPLARVARMRVDQIGHEREQVSVLLGRDRLLLPDPVGRLILRLAHAPHGATLHDHRATGWLFPGQVAGHPITGERLRRRLSADLGKLPIRPGRHSAVTSMLQDVPAPVLADLLGFSQNRAHQWVELAASNYTTYVAARSPRS